MLVDLQIPGTRTKKGMGKGRRQTYRNVPAENNNSMPVHHWPFSPSMCVPPPRMLTNSQVVNAPNGAARLKMMRWPRAALLLSPCFSNTDVSPNAAGALWIMIATKMMNPSLVLEEVAEAPIAMPSAAAWITRPVVVARERVCFGVGVSDWRKESDSSSPMRWRLNVGLGRGCRGRCVGWEVVAAGSLMRVGAACRLGT